VIYRQQMDAYFTRKFKRNHQFLETSDYSLAEAFLHGPGNKAPFAGDNRKPRTRASQGILFSPRLGDDPETDDHKSSPTLRAPGFVSHHLYSTVFDHNMPI
jgi:hypothetical protein